jgi:hypothetical protein
MDHDPYVEHSLRTSMFFPSTRLFVAGNPKAAGTTLRWWLLAAHGVDVVARTETSWWGESAPFQTVWDDGVDLDYTWPDLSESQRRDALTSEDVLTVLPVRNPVTRLFSAWSGKYLVAEPYYAERLPDGFPALPAAIESEQQIGELFSGFVEALAEEVDAQGFEAIDVHFWPQHRLLGRTPVGQVLELRQEDMRTGLAAVAEHMGSHGVKPGEAPRINETVIPYLPTFVTDATLATVVNLYSGDFERFGYGRARPEGTPRPVDLDWLNDVRGRNGRYGVLHKSLFRLRDDNERQRQEIDTLRHEIDACRRREQELTDSTSWKVTGPLRWASEKVRR